MASNTSFKVEVAVVQRRNIVGSLGSSANAGLVFDSPSEPCEMMNIVQAGSCAVVTVTAPSQDAVAVNHFVFLVDASGSMAAASGQHIEGICGFVDAMKFGDVISVVTFAEKACEVLKYFIVADLNAKTAAKAAVKTIKSDGSTNFADGAKMVRSIVDGAPAILSGVQTSCLIITDGKADSCLGGNNEHLLKNCASIVHCYVIGVTPDVNVLFCENLTKGRGWYEHAKNHAQVSESLCKVGERMSKAMTSPFALNFSACSGVRFNAVYSDSNASTLVEKEKKKSASVDFGVFRLGEKRTAFIWLLQKQDEFDPNKQVPLFTIEPKTSREVVFHAKGISPVRPPTIPKLAESDYASVKKGAEKLAYDFAFKRVVSLLVLQSGKEDVRRDFESFVAMLRAKLNGFRDFDVDVGETCAATIGVIDGVLSSVSKKGPDDFCVVASQQSTVRAGNVEDLYVSIPKQGKQKDAKRAEDAYMPLNVDQKKTPSDADYIVLNVKK